MINETLLQFIWKSSILKTKLLLGSKGENIKIIHPGHHNFDQGPDFSFSKISINEVTWVGHVEIHVYSSQWNQHKHSGDQQYQNVILHVVWENDMDIQHSGRNIICLELKNYISKEVLQKHEELQKSIHIISCHSFLKDIPPLKIKMQLDSMLVQRFQQKTERIATQLNACEHNWEEVFYKNICRYLVTPTNAEAMERLTDIISLQHIQKLKSKFETEVVLFGCSGLLENQTADQYMTELKIEYRFLKSKYNLREMSPAYWKFLRMRPAHFPTIRIAQIATLFQKKNLFADIIQSPEYKLIKKMFFVEIDNYWDNHFQFGLQTTSSCKHHIGRSTLEILIINVIGPMLFCYGQYYANENIQEKALQLLEHCKAEENHITRKWTQLGGEIESAGDSQAIIQLIQHYCTRKRCLECQIGNAIIQSND